MNFVLVGPCGVESISSFKVRETEDVQVWSSCSRAPMVGNMPRGRNSDSFISIVDFFNSLPTFDKDYMHFFFVPYG